jgi:tetratricopeptide (TPR) repeat protein
MQEKKIMSMRSQLDKAFEQKDFYTAVKYIKDLLCIVPRDVGLHLDLMEAYLSLKDLEMVNRIGEELLVFTLTDNQKASIHYSKSFLLYEAERFKGALSEVTVSVNLSNTSKNLKLRAKINSALGYIDSAIFDLNEAIKLNPSDYELYHYRKKHFSKYNIFLLEKYKECSRDAYWPHLDPAIKDNPKNPVLYLLRADARKDFVGSLYTYESVLADYNRALKIEPNNGIALIAKAVFRKRESVQDCEIALQDNEAVMKMSPSNSLTYLAAKGNIELLNESINEMRAKASVKSEVFFDNLKDKVIELIDSAKSEIKIAVAWITDDSLISELLKKQRAKVQVTLIYYDDLVNDKNKFIEVTT